MNDTTDNQQKETFCTVDHANKQLESGAPKTPEYWRERAKKAGVKPKYKPWDDAFSDTLARDEKS